MNTPEVDTFIHEFLRRVEDAKARPLVTGTPEEFILTEMFDANELYLEDPHPWEEIQDLQGELSTAEQRVEDLEHDLAAAQKAARDIVALAEQI